MATSQLEAMPHKERLLRTGMKLFYENGFNGTTVDTVLATAGVPKGSFYHHFGSKDVFGQAVLDRYARFQEELFGKWAGKRGLSTAEKLTGYAKEMAQMFTKSGFQRACLVGKFSTEVSATSDVFRTQLDAQIHAWQNRLVQLLAEGQNAGDVRTDQSADELAIAVLSLIQGSFVLALSTRDRKTLRVLGTTIGLLVEAADRSHA